jgi:hypothetical protein
LRPSVLAIALVAVSAAPALAFHPAPSFDESANEGGGGGMHFTGAPRGRGYDCSICHVDSAAMIEARIELEPAADGAFQPGQTYQVAVRLVGEHRGFGAAGNQNSFLAEFVDDTGAHAGTVANLGERIRMVGDGNVIGGEPLAGNRWTFAWQAPAAGTGAVTLHLGMVDGDGAGVAETPATDPNRDDVAIVAVRLCEGGPGCPDRASRPAETSAAIGCTAGRGAGAGMLLVVLAIAFARRRRALVLLAVVAGCFDPTTAEECEDRICGRDAAPRGDAVSCDENWACTTWEAPPGSDQATRTCTDLNMTGTTECKPDEGPVTLPALDLNYYKCRVSPIIQRGCSMQNCHGTETGRPFRTYARGRLRNDEIIDFPGCLNPGPSNLQDKGTGTVMCEGWWPHTAAEWKKNFDSARSFMLGVAQPEDSLMLREPVVGGLPHVEVKLFRDTDPDYATIRNWLDGATLASCNTGPN